MKTYFFTFILICALAGCHTRAQMPHGKNISLTIQMDSTISGAEQWVYLWHYEGNEFTIDDSVFIDKGRQEISLYAFAEEERPFNVVFSEKGPIEWYVILTPDKPATANLKLYNELIGSSRKIEGAVGHNERSQNINLHYNLNSRLRDLSAQLTLPQLSALQKDSIQAAIQTIQKKLVDVDLDAIHHSPSSFVTERSLESLKSKVSRDSLIALCKIAQKRFPSDKDIDQLLHNRKRVLPPESEESKARARRLGLIKQRRIKEAIASRQQTPTVKAGDEKIADLTLRSVDGKRIAINELKGEYILIDFWASWCIPCLEGLPYVRQAKKIIGDKLTICMISMDKKDAVWKKRIADERLGEYVNLNVYEANGMMNKEALALGIHSIPYNVLLNKQRQIIAKDIHQKDLLDKLYELMKQTE